MSYTNGYREIDTGRWISQPRQDIDQLFTNRSVTSIIPSNGSVFYFYGGDAMEPVVTCNNSIICDYLDIPSNIVYDDDTKTKSTESKVVKCVDPSRIVVGLTLQDMGILHNKLTEVIDCQNAIYSNASFLGGHCYMSPTLDNNNIGRNCHHTEEVENSVLHIS